MAMPAWPRAHSCPLLWEWSFWPVTFQMRPFLTCTHMPQAAEHVSQRDGTLVTGAALALCSQSPKEKTSPAPAAAAVAAVALRKVRRGNFVDHILFPRLLFHNLEKAQVISDYCFIRFLLIPLPKIAYSPYPNK